MAKIKKIVGGTVVEVDENPMVKTIVNGVVVEKPLDELKKKEPLEILSSDGGEAGISEPPLQKGKITEYLASFKEPKQIKLSGEKVVLPIQRPKKVDTQFGISKERAVKDILPKFNEISKDADPLGAAESRASQTKNLQESADFMAAANLLKDQLPSFYDAYKVSQVPVTPNKTNSLISQRAAEYESATKGLREIKAPDLAAANDEFIEYNIMPKIERAAVIYQISKNPSFEKELKAAGTSIDDPNLKYNLGSAKLGQIMEQFLDSPEVASFAQKEDDNIAFALQYAKDKNLERNPEWGVSSVANKVSREFERSEKRRNPIAPLATQKLKDDFDEVAREVLNPEEYKVYEEKIKGNEEQYLDTPSFFTGFADEGKKIYQGFLNTAKKLTGETEKDIIREQWNKEASNVSANPEGLRNQLTETGKMTGLVATLAGTGNVLSGIAGTGKTAKTIADAVNIGTAFWGDMVDQGVMKYPGDPVKAFTSASLNTLAFLAMGKDILPVKKVESAFKRIQPEVEAVVKNLTNGSISREAAKQELNTIAKKGISIASEGLAQNIKVSAELTGLGVLNEGLDVLMDMDEDKLRKYYPTGVHGDTFKAMFLGNSLVSAVAGYGAYRVKNNTARDAIYDAATNPKRYQRVIEEMSITDPNITKQELLDNLSFAVETKRLLDQRGVPEVKQKDYLLKALGERAATIEKERIADSTLKKEQEEKIKQAQAEKEAILSAEEVVETPTIPLDETQLPKEEALLTEEAISQEIADLRAKEKAEYAAMDDPNSEVKRKEIYDKYDKLITPLLEKEKEAPAAPVEEELPFGEVAPREVVETKEERNLTKRALNIEASTPIGEVFQYFISGGKISPEALTEFFGKERRLGMGKIGVEERRSRTSLTNKNAPSIEALAEKIAGTDRLDQVQEYREAIEEALLNHSGTKTMAEELVRDYDVDFAETKRAAELEELGKEVEAETQAFVSQIPAAQQQEIIRVLDRFRDNDGFINWRQISEEIKDGFEPVILELSEPSQKIINDAIKQFEETGRVGRISTEAVRPEAKAGDAARKLAERIRAGKISKEGLRTSTGFDVVFDAALEVIATSLEAGASIADAIESGLSYIRDTEYYKNLTDKKGFEDKFSNKLNEEYAIQEQAAGEVPVQPEARASKEVEGGVPPTEPPKATEESKAPRKERQKALLNRIIESPEVPESLKEKIREKGLSYVPATQAEATRLANSILDSIGIDEAVKMASNGEFSETFGGLNTAVLSEAASRLVNDPVKQAQIFDILDTSLRSKGQDISYINEFYTKNPEGVVIYQNQQRKKDFEQFSSGKEKEWQDALNILKSENEALRKELDELKAKPTPEGVKNAKAKAAAARQKRAAIIQKYRQNKGGGLTLTAGGLTKEGIEFVGEVALTYIQEGVANAEVVIQKVIADLRTTLGKEPSLDVKNDVEQLVRKAVQEKKGKPVIDKIRKKLDGLSNKEKEEVIRKSYDKIIESGGLEIQEFKDIIAEVLGRGPLSEADAAKMKKLTVAVNEVEAKALDAQELRTKEALEAYKISQRDAAVAARELALMFNNKPNILKRLTSFVQLSTLGIPALINNPFYNVVNQVFLRFPVGLVNTLLDRSISGAAKLANKQISPETNILSRRAQAEFFKKLNLGFKEAGEQVLTGLNRQDYIQKEIYAQSIQPLESMKALFRYAKGEQKMKLDEVVDKALQATLGVPAEGVARVLNLGDKPFRFGAEGATAAVFSDALGLGKDLDYDLFIEFPKAEAYRRFKQQGLSEAEALQKAEYIERSIIQEGKRATFQQDNFLNDKLSQLFGDEKSGVGAISKTLLVSPYIKIPSNAFWSYYNLAHPEIALLQAFAYGGKAAKLKSTDPIASKMALREARYWFAHSAVGLAYVSVISSMVSAGVFTPGTTADDTKKEKEGRAYYGKPGTTNITKLMAWLKGEDPTSIKEGYAIQNKWFGHIGTLGNTIARRELEMTPEQRANRQNLLEYLISNLAPNEVASEALEGLQSGVFANTSSIFNALQSDYGLRRWGLNTINLLTNVIHPAALSQLSRSELPYYSSTKADTFMNEIKNSFLQRSSVLRKSLGEQPPAKIGIWGDRLEKKDNFMMRWFGISKENPDNFAQPLYDIVLRTNNIAYFPPTIKPEIEDNGKVTELNTAQARELETLVGQQRKLLVAPLLNDLVILPKYGSWSGIEKYYIDEGLKKEEAVRKSDEIKEDILRNAYSLGYEFGKQFFLNNHPEFRNETYNKGEMKMKRKIIESTRKQLKGIR